ncbi:peroxidase family protein [Rosistilla oblonga]|uniref:Peroxidase n=1 Tax=Rosistilla oblonga TaxID=2527990 RepID=A0A518IYA4_9BACT|nr:peroxidase family protein [Rosistilla oblonga]QDV58067.1 peroxidase [Rosistilla oblonga]
MQKSPTATAKQRSWIKRAAALLPRSTRRGKHDSLARDRHDFCVETMEPLIVLSASSICGASISELVHPAEPQGYECQPVADFADCKPTAASCDVDLSPHNPTDLTDSCDAPHDDLFDPLPPPASEDQTPREDHASGSQLASRLVQDIEALLRDFKHELSDSGTTNDIQLVLAPTININGNNNHFTLNLTVDLSGVQITQTVGQYGNPAMPTPPSDPPIVDDPIVEFNDDLRTIDGTQNNLQHNSGFGATGSQLLRLAPADYGDDYNTPAGSDRPSARTISNLVNDQVTDLPNDRDITDFLWVWGQFIDHDIDLSEADSGESFPIAIPQGDPFFDPDGTGTAMMPLDRSGYLLDADGVRQQYNAITSYIDASQIYGSDAETETRLRSFAGGQLTMPDQLLQMEADAHGQLGFYSGDVRVGENIALTSMHTLFSREHNRIATELAASEYQGHDLSDAAVDEEIFQRARAIVGAELQHITYDEFLPTLLGENALDAYAGYDAMVDPSIATEFSTAAFRFGHTTLSPELLRLDPDGNEIAAGNVSLRDAFFSADTLLESGIAPILQGAAAQVSQTIDPYVIDDVRNFLFSAPGQGGLDLASLNIQRGRDHGLSSYNDTREALGLGRIDCFEQISSDDEVIARLQSAYESVDDIDLWVGGLSEDHVADGNLGETFRTIIVDQFERLRDGDRYWYENALSATDLAMVKDTQLSDIIRRNTTADTVQDNVFVLPASGTTCA